MTTHPHLEGLIRLVAEWRDQANRHVQDFAGCAPACLVDTLKECADELEAALAALPGGGVDVETEWVVTSSCAGTTGHPRFATEAAAFAHFAENSQTPSYINPSRMRQAQVYRVRTETTDVTASALAPPPLRTPTRPTAMTVEYETAVVDPLYAEAKRLVIEQRHASIAFVQRKMLIGYNRAARFVEAMEHEGIVSAPDYKGARTVKESQA